MNERDLVLAANVAAVLNAANARRPVDRHGNASVGAFVAGWPTSELPLQTLAVHLALNGVALARGDLRGWRGAAAAVLAAGSGAGLVGIHRVAKHAGEIYERALTDELGSGYRDAIVHPKFPGPDAASAGVPGVVRMMRVRRRFAHHANISYGPQGKANLLDIWSRDDLPSHAHAPVLLQMPGGAWVTGSKQDQAYPLMSHLAEKGWVCVAINYRLSPRHRWPVQIVDVKRAIAWVRANIADYGGDPSFIALTGGSAGGHLSSLAALTPNEATWQPGFEDDDTSVAACAPFYGAYDWTDRDGLGNRALVPFIEKHVAKTTRAADPELFDRASPMSRTRPGAPPFLITHGANDSLIPVEQGRLFAQRLRDASNAPVAFAELPGAQHAFDIFGSVRSNLTAEAVGHFLGYVYGRHLERVA